MFHKSSLENQPYYNLESIFRAFKRKKMKASRRLAENDIITRGVTVKIQQVAVRGNYKNPSSRSQPLVSEDGACKKMLAWSKAKIKNSFILKKKKCAQQNQTYLLVWPCVENKRSQE